MVEIESFNDWINILESQPGITRIKDVLDQIIEAKSQLSRSQELKIDTVILNNTVPQVYFESPYSLKKVIINQLKTVIGLGNILGKLRLKTDAFKIYFSLLKDLLCGEPNVFHQRGVVQLMINRSKNRAEIKELETILFKGKAWSIISELLTNEPYLYEDSINTLGPFHSLETYITCLCNEIEHCLNDDSITIQTLASFLNSLSSIHASNTTIYEFFFNKPKWGSFCKLFKQMSLIEKKNHLGKLLLLHIGTQTKTLDYTQVNATVVILNKLGSLYQIIDGSMLDRFIVLQNEFIISVACLLISQDESTLISTIKLQSLKFGDPILMKKEPISQQMYRTILLGELLSYAPTNYLQAYLKNDIFLSSISNRLSSFSNSVKSIGVVLADRVCELAQQEKIFKMENLDGYETLLKNRKNTMDLPILESAWDNIKSVQVEEPIEPELTVVEKPNLVIRAPDSDDESDDDDPSVGPKKKVNKIIYIKDILTYLTADQNDEHAYEKRKIALTTAPTLIRRKSSFGNEVAFYAEDLLKEFVALSNTYEEKDFDTLRLNCMIAVVASCHESAPYLVELLASGDYSLSQRMSILSTLSLVARELKGFQDEIVEKSYLKDSFPSKKLPEALHKAYIALESPTTYELLQESIQDDLMKKVSNDFKELSVGKVLRVSKKLQKNDIVPVKQPIHGFSKIIGRDFFFPLVKTWHEVGGDIDIGHYTPILVAHYLKTLALILHCAYPSAIDMLDMTNEFLLILVSVIPKLKTEEIQVVESIVTGILLVLDFADDQFIAENYSEYLALIQEWLSNIWESIIDSKVKSLSAGLLLKLNSIMENYQRTMMDQLNSVY